MIPNFHSHILGLEFAIIAGSSSKKTRISILLGTYLYFSFRFEWQEIYQI